MRSTPKAMQSCNKKKIRDAYASRFEKIDRHIDSAMESNTTLIVRSRMEYLKGLAASIKRRFFSISTFPSFVKQPMTTPLQINTVCRSPLHSDTLAGQDILDHDLHLPSTRSLRKYLVFIVVKISTSGTNNDVYRNVNRVFHRFYSMV